MLRDDHSHAHLGWPHASAVTRAPRPCCLCSWLTGGYLGWRGLAAVYAFFWLAAVVQR